LAEHSDSKTWLVAVGSLTLGALGLVSYVAKRFQRDSPALVDAADLVLDLPERSGGTGTLIEVEGAVNFRDIGGYYTVDGKHRVRRGQVFRSSNLSKLTPQGADKLEQMGIKLVCDLRTPDEIKRNPDQIPADTGIGYRHMPVASDNPIRVLKMMLFQKRKIGDLFREAYKYDLVDRGAEHFGNVLRTLAEEDNRPAVIHCTAGKDRAGVTIALLLGLLDVPEDVILADYSLSNRNYADFRAMADDDLNRIRIFGIGEADIQAVMLADAEVLKAALDHLRDEYGSLRAYLLGPAGLDEETITALRESLLEPV